MPNRKAVNLNDYPYFFQTGDEDMIIKLDNVRLSFPKLFTAEQFQGQGEYKFSAAFIIEQGNPAIKAVEAAIIEVAKEKWAAKASAVLDSIRGNPNKFCFRDGNTKPDLDGYAGNMFITASNTVRPLVVGRDRTPLAEEDGKIYAGCYVNASIKLFAYSGKWGNGISAELRAVQFVRDGQPFSGSAPATVDEFDDLSVDTSAYA